VLEVTETRAVAKYQTHIGDQNKREISALHTPEGVWGNWEKEHSCDE